MRAIQALASTHQGSAAVTAVYRARQISARRTGAAHPVINHLPDALPAHEDRHV